MRKGLFIGLAAALATLAQAGTYEANWDSLNSRPCPQWWKDAKFGIFIHWGLFSVPAFAPADSKSVYDCYAEHYGNPERWANIKAFPEYHAKHHPNKSYSDFAAEFTTESLPPSFPAAAISIPSFRRENCLESKLGSISSKTCLVGFFGLDIVFADLG